MKRYFTKVFLTILLVMYLINLLRLFDINLDLVDITTLFKVAAILAFVRILLSFFTFLKGNAKWLQKISSFFKEKEKEFFPKEEEIQEQKESISKPVRISFGNNPEAHSFRNIIAIILALLLLYIFWDITSVQENKDFVMLFFLVFWTFSGGFLWRRGKYSIAAGMLFLLFCPFFIVSGKEYLAEKSAVWAYLFFVAGVLQEIFFQYERKISGNVKQLFLLLKQIEVDFAGESVGIASSDDKNSRKFIDCLNLKVQKLRDLSLRYYQSLSIEEKRSFGNGYLESLEKFCEGVADIYGSLGYYEDEKLYFKVKSSLFNTLVLTKTMLSQQKGDIQKLKQINNLLFELNQYLIL